MKFILDLLDKGHCKISIRLGALALPLALMSASIFNNTPSGSLSLVLLYRGWELCYKLQTEGEVLVRSDIQKTYNTHKTMETTEATAGRKPRCGRLKHNLLQACWYTAFCSSLVCILIVMVWQE